MQDYYSNHAVIKAIPGMDGYYADNFGKIYSAWKPHAGPTPILADDLREMKTRNDRGWRRIGLNRQLNHRHLSVHALVLMAFKGPRPSPVHQACHSDGIRHHNHITNLRWGTPKENQADRRLHGTNFQGESHPRAKLNDEVVKSVRARFAAGGSIPAMAKEYGVRYQIMFRAITGRTWGHL